MAPLPQKHVVEEVQASEANNNLLLDDIVISGMSGIYPNCHNVNELFEKLYAKVDLIANEKLRWNYQHPEAPKYLGMAPDLKTFDAQFFKVHRKLGITMDAMSRKLLEHAYQAIYDSGISPLELRGKKVGVFVGSSISDFEKVYFYATKVATALGIAGCSRSMFANRISYWLDAKGPSISIDASCSSSMMALERACDYIKNGICDAAIVGGANLCFHPHVSVHFKRLGILCDDGKSRSFDRNGSGTVRADAVNCLFLQKAANAKRVYASIAHVKTSYNIDNENLSKENKYGPARPKKCLVEFWNDFYREAKVSPQDVEYVEAYGSAVSEADREELNALEDVFCKGKEKPLLIGSVISNIGHTEAASGVSAITKVLLAYHTGQIAPNLHYETPHDEVRAIREGRLQVVVENQPFGGTYAAVNSHSLGGLNCHTLLRGFNKMKWNRVFILHRSRERYIKLDLKRDIERHRERDPEQTVKPEIFTVSTQAKLQDLKKYKTNIPWLVAVSGRTESSVSKIIDHLKARPLDAEEIGLLHNIHKQDIQGHLARGYAVLTCNEEDETTCLAEKCDYYPDIKRPVWFVYSGMGSQWAGMGAQLMRIPIFASAIEKCHKILEPKGMDLMKILVESDKTIYDNILNSFVGIAAVQIGLTDILRALEIVPDNIIGHSVGELGCAYADGCFTAEEMILSAYSRGLVSVQTPFIRGAMAAVGLGYKDIIDLCPPEIEVACHNGPESSTISGPADVMRAFVQELTSKGIFAKEVPCSNIAYHSRYIAEAGPRLLKYLSEIIKDPKPRSQKWVSSSVPQDKWDEPEAKYSSAEYHTNNLLRSVLFEETSRLIPNNAIVIEIAPHGLLQAILKRSLGQNCVHVPLTRRGHSDPVTFLLDNIGNLYQAGLSPQLQALYPKIEYPVSTGTPMLSHLVEWMHSETWPIPIYAEAVVCKAGRRVVRISIYDDEYKYITGNVKDGAIMFSEAGMLVLAWETFAMILQEKMNVVPVLFSDVRFHTDIVVTHDDVLVLDIAIQKGSGQFEITYKDNIVVSGCIQTLEQKHEKQLHTYTTPISQDYLTSSEIYKLFHVRGYSYSGFFRSIYKSNVEFTSAEMIWNEDWVTLIDSLLQLNVLKRNHNGISKIKSMRKIIISVKEHKTVNIMKADKDVNIINAEISNFGNATRCGGVVIQDITYNDVPHLQRPSITKRREFIPYHPVGSFDMKIVIHIFLQIVAENSAGGQVNALEFIGSEDEQHLGDLMITISNELTNVNVNCKCKPFESVSDLKVVKGRNLLIGHGFLSDKKVQKYLDKTIDKNKFIISVEKNEKLIENSPFVEVVAMETPSGRLVLAKLPKREEANGQMSVIADPEDVANVSFLEHTRNNLLPNQKLVIISDLPSPSGLIALVRKWKTSPEKNNVNLIVTDTRTDSDCNLNEQLSKDLAVVVYQKGIWGCEYYLPAGIEQVISSHTRLYSAVPGDIETLSWIETGVNVSPQSVKVRFAGLSHYDVMKATGENPATTEKDFYGIDFSGINSRGERVMGLVACGALATAVVPDEELLWPVPDHWTLEDAATVPLPYAHAFYCLQIKSDLQKGTRILVHCGAGALGQAVISIALSVGCEVFTTVSTIEKKHLLKLLFPELQDDHIGSSRDTSFEHLVMEQTNGQGCETVISCLNGYLREASMRCVSKRGTFINVSMSDCYENSSFKFYYLIYERSFCQINFSLIFETENTQTKKELQRMVAKGIAEGYVRPLTRVTLAGREAPRAVRLLASGNHRGRVLLSPDNVPAQLKMSLSNSGSYAVVCGDHELGLELVDRLIRRGAKNVMIHYNQRNKSGYLKVKLSAWKSIGANIIISTHDLEAINGALDYLQESTKLGHVDGIFIIDETNGIEAAVSVAERLDKAARKICHSLKYFVVLRPTADQAEPASQRTCLRRRLNNLPALYLNMPTFGETKEFNQSISSALDALETSLRLNYQDVITLASKETPQFDFLEKIGNILGVQLAEVPHDTTLQTLGLDFEKAEEIKNVLERRYKYPCSRRNVPELTVGRLKEAEAKLTSTKKEPTKLEVFFRSVDPDELNASAELLVMQTLVYEPQIRSDEFESKETYLILIPGMEGHHGVFTRLCERLKIFSLCMQPGFDNPQETPRQTAQRFVKKLTQMIEFEENFYLLGYSYGVLIAMEMAALLEQRGLRGTVFCVDSAPDVFKVQLKTILGEISESKLQNDVIYHMYSIMAGQPSDELLKRLANISLWEEKVDVAWQHLRGLVHYSSQYAHKCIESAYGRIQEAKKYTTELLQKTPIRSKIVLIRSRHQQEALAAYPRDLGLSKYTKQPVDVHDLTTDHADALEDLNCTNIVHKYLDLSLLEEYSQKNLCETYLPNGIKFIELSKEHYQ